MDVGFTSTPNWAVGKRVSKLIIFGPAGQPIQTTIKVYYVTGTLENGPSPKLYVHNYAT